MRRPAYPAFLLFARDAVEELAEGTGSEAEYPCDIWRLHRIPELVLNVRDWLDALTLDPDTVAEYRG